MNRTDTSMTIRVGDIVKYIENGRTLSGLTGRVVDTRDMNTNVKIDFGSALGGWWVNIESLEKVK